MLCHDAVSYGVSPVQTLLYQRQILHTTTAESPYQSTYAPCQQHFAIDYQDLCLLSLRPELFSRLESVHAKPYFAQLLARINDFHFGKIRFQLVRSSGVAVTSAHAYLGQTTASNFSLSYLHSANPTRPSLVDLRQANHHLLKMPRQLAQPNRYLLHVNAVVAKFGVGNCPAPYCFLSSVPQLIPNPKYVDGGYADLPKYLRYPITALVPIRSVMPHKSEIHSVPGNVLRH